MLGDLNEPLRLSSFGEGASNDARYVVRAAPLSPCDEAVIREELIRAYPSELAQCHGRTVAEMLANIERYYPLAAVLARVRRNQTRT